VARAHAVHGLARSLSQKDRDGVEKDQHRSFEEVPIGQTLVSPLSSDIGLSGDLDRGVGGPGSFPPLGVRPARA
jgi:hypothetical protein